MTNVSGRMYADMLRGGSGRLAENRQSVNDLNVFPIPDGDTGDNMLMTLDSGASAAKHAGERLCDTAKAASDGMLMGARGNSGVILSRIFSGITGGFEGLESADITDFKKSMNEGVKAAYGAVPKPVEGTILTVFKDAVNYANENSDGSSGIKGYFDNLLCEMRRSLERTPDLLPVLSEAGVVDSGGAGLLCIFEGMRDALGGIIAESTADTGSVGHTNAPDFSLFTSDSLLEFGYCTEFIMRLQKCKTDIDNFDSDSLINYLQSVGDSVVAFKDGSIVKVHVHTMHPGQVLEHCQQFGEFLTLKIENMTLQNKKAVATGGNAQEILAKKKRKKVGIVTVATGEGLKQTFKSLGVDEVVDGGQSMNPSAAELIDAFDKANADKIYVFPNNKNIIMTAKQAAELYKKSTVVVVETRTIGEGYTAVSMMDTGADTESVLAELNEVIAGVMTLTVSRASKCSQMSGISVKEGDFIGFEKDEILSDGKSREEALELMLEKRPIEDYGVMMILVGQDTDKSAAKEICDKLQKKYKSTEVISIDGGQPIYDYIAVLT